METQENNPTSPGVSDNPLDPGVLEHTRTVATVVEERIRVLNRRKRRVPRHYLEETNAIREEMGYLIRITGHLHGAICDVERRISSQP